MVTKPFQASLAYLLVILLMAACSKEAAKVPASDDRLVIAHRGASGYLPEHTMAAKAMAYAQGADYIEQDLVMTSDDELVVLHDLELGSITNVKDVYPDRARDDGRFYVIDFTLDEIRQLDVVERFRDDDGRATPVYADRFPLARSRFRVHTFAEEIELIQGLNRSTGRSVGLYPEIKNPAFHRAQDKDISRAVLQVLADYGYSGPGAKAFLQCFDAGELKRIHAELLPAMEMELPLVQLLGNGPVFAPLQSAEGIRQVSAYAAGIGPSMHLLIDADAMTGDFRDTGLVALAHAAGLQVHPYTFRREADQIPPYARDFDHLLEIFFDELGVDGVFTDFPDLVVRFLEAKE